MIPYTTIPLISACFLVLVGVLIGHMIWYRYRDEQEHLAENQRRQIDALQSSLMIQTNDSAEASLRAEKLAEQLVAAGEAGVELERRIEHHESLYESAAADLERSEQVNETLRQQILEQEQALTLSRRQTDDAAAQIGQLESDLKKRTADFSAETDQLQSQLQQEANSAETLTQTVSRREQRIGDLEKVCQTWQERSDAADAEIARLSDLVRRQESILAEQTGELEGLPTMRRERDRLQLRLNESEHESAMARKELDQTTQTLRVQMNMLSRDNEEISQANDALRESSADYARQLESQIRLNDDLSRRIDSALADLGRLEEKAVELQLVKDDRDRLIDELDSRSEEIKRVRADLEESHLELESQVKDAEQLRQSLERALASASEEVAQLQQERERLEGVEDEVVELDATRRQLRKELDLARQERDEALTAENSTREIASELRDELNDRLESMKSLEDERTEAVRQLSSARTEIQLVQRQLEAVNEQVAEIKAENLSLQERRKADNAQVQRMKSELETATALYSQVASQVKSYREERHADQPTRNRQTGTGKRASLSNVTDDAKSPFSFRLARRREEDERARDDAKSYRDSQLGTLYSTAPLRCDELTRIDALDESLEQQLNSLGVYTFEQIMKWDAQVVAEFSRRLATDVIGKNDWIGQARRLFHQYRAAA